LRLDVPHNNERTIEMLSAKETAIHLGNLRQSHEITRQLTQSRIVLFHYGAIGWHGEFYGIPGRPEGTPIALGVSRKAAANEVAALYAKRFPHSDITVRL
jgi:hypothetical protein